MESHDRCFNSTDPLVRISYVYTTALYVNVNFSFSSFFSSLEIAFDLYSTLNPSHRKKIITTKDGDEARW